MRQKGHREKANHHRSFASPLRNRVPVLTMAAGHLHLEEINGHQWAEDAALPKLVVGTAAIMEQAAEIWMRKIRGSRCHGGYPMKGTVGKYHLMEMWMTPT